MAIAKTKSLQQVRFLLSKGSPLSKAEKETLKSELHSGKVKISKKKTKGNSKTK